MPKRTLVLFILFLCIYVVVLAQSEENLIITTYYPSRYAVYNDLRARRIAVGYDYVINSSQYCWPPDSCSHQFSGDAALIVQADSKIYGEVVVRGDVIITGWPKIQYPVSAGNVVCFNGRDTTYGACGEINHTTSTCVCQ